MSKERNEAAALILTTLLGKTNRRLRISAKALAAELSGKVKLGRQKSKAADVRKGLLPSPVTGLLPRLPKGFLPQPVAAATSDGAALARQFRNDMRIGSLRVEAPPLRRLSTVRQIATSLPSMNLPADVVRRVTSLLTRIKRRQDVLAAMLGRPLFGAFPGSLADPARQQADTLLFRLGVLFNEAVPAGETRRTVLRDVMRRLRLAKAENPSLNAADWLRKKLFDKWRTDFMDAVALDLDLVRKLRDQAGLRVVRNPGGSTAFEMWDGASWKGIDLDHTIEGLSETVARAVHADELEVLISAQNIALTSPHENRVLLEKIRNHYKDTYKDFVDANGALNADELDQLIKLVDDWPN